MDQWDEICRQCRFLPICMDTQKFSCPVCKYHDRLLRKKLKNEKSELENTDNGRT